ncbi:MAG: hypothetical protein IJQ55_00440 [Alphaproteobacteria bacterium]|nr:hypothetical protein [Alphaproteobacteria bacterium]
MSYYKKYVEPVVVNIKPLLEKETKKGTKLINVIRLQKIVANIKKPLFEIRSKKYKEKKIFELYQELYNMYKDMVYILEAQYPDISGRAENFVMINMPADGNKKKATASRFVQQNDNLKSRDIPVGTTEYEIPKKYRGILGKPNSNGNVYINKSTSGNNATYLWVVPKDGKAKATSSLFYYDLSRAVSGRESLETAASEFKKMANMTKFHDATDKRNRPRKGGVWLEKELAQEIQNYGRFERAAKERKRQEEPYKNTEAELLKSISRQDEIVNRLRIASQNKMADVVAAGKNARISAFKNAQEKVTRLIVEQEKLQTLRDYLKRVRKNKESVNKRFLKSIEQELLQNYYRRER